MYIDIFWKTTFLLLLTSFYPPNKDQRTICKQMNDIIDKDEYDAKTRHQFNDKLTLNFETIFLQKRYKWIFLQYL